MNYKIDVPVTVRRKQRLWIWEDHRMIKKQITLVPFFYEIFNELLVNTASKKQRDPTMNSIKVNIDVAKSLISFGDNSDLSVDYYDLSLFCELRIETAEVDQDLQYKEVFTDNKIVIRKDECRGGENWTKCYFKPALAKCGMDRLEDDIVGLMKRRVVDLAGSMVGKGVKVELTGKLIPFKTFEDYVKLYPIMGTFSLYEKVNDGLEIFLGISDGCFEQMSFVNNYATIKGGTHIDYITSQITCYLAKRMNLEPNYVKSCLCVFVNALIDNPCFASLTKENLTNPKGSLGSTFKLTPEFLEKISNLVFSYVLSKQHFEDGVFNVKLNEKFKKTDGKRKGNLNIPKLKDAYKAGTDKSEGCTLILTQGDSAKDFAMYGLSFVTKDKYGVYPVKGKLLNLREASREKLQENADLQNIKRILGLKVGKTYENVKELRYGRLIIMAAQDHNGSYFTGLLINFLHLFWPSLLKVPNFVFEFITPVVKASNKERTEMLLFYTIPEYEAEKKALANYEIEYCKGLGTIEAEEIAEYFRNLDKYIRAFFWSDDEDGSAIDLAFSDMKIGERKDWLQAHQTGAYIHSNWKQIRYRDFICKEIILFSNQRSIPSMMDGLKPGQREILFFALKESLNEEIEVSQFSRYVSAHSAYRHDEASLVGTIISMAQNYVGSNNINLFQQKGQFGTRLKGGKDHASGNIFTRLSPIARYIFPKDDELFLNYLNDDVPAWFVPIIPMVLVNGCERIGTRWSLFIPNYNPRDIIANIKDRLNGKIMVPMCPWYKGFKGSIKKIAASVYTTTGIMKRYSENALSITELPLRSWTEEYKEFLQAGQDGKDKEAPFIKAYTAHNNDKTVHFEIVTTEDQAKATYEELLEKFKLTTTLSTANMYLFDANGQLKKYDTPEQILEDFCGTLLKFYENRRIAQLCELKKALLKLENKVTYLDSLLDGVINLVNVNYDELWAKLKAKGLKKESEVDEEVAKDLKIELQGNTSKTDPKAEYHYLLSIGPSLWSCETIDKLKREIEIKKKEIGVLAEANSESLWERDLDALDEQLQLDGNYPSAKSSLEIADESPPNEQARAKRAAASPLPQSANMKKPKRE